MGESFQTSEGWDCPGSHKLTCTLAPSSLLQALLTVLSHVLCFLSTSWYLPLLVFSLVLCWLNLLYYTRGFQHTGIYSVMIQKVRGRSDPVKQTAKGSHHSPNGLSR